MKNRTIDKKTFEICKAQLTYLGVICGIEPFPLIEWTDIDIIFVWEAVIENNKKLLTDILNNYENISNIEESKMH